VHDFTVDLGSLTLACREYGGSGRPVVLVHGGPGLNLAIWDEFAPLLTDRYRVIAYDQRCNGRSDDSEPCSFDAFVDDLHAVVRALELEHPAILGQSWGGWIALSYAARYDDAAALVVADGPITYGMPEITGSEWLEIERLHGENPLFAFAGTEAEADELLAELRRSRRYDRFDEAVARRNMRLDRDGRLRYRWSLDEYLRLDRIAFGDAISRLDPDAIYPRIRCPVLLVGATEGKQAEPGKPFSRAAVEAVHARYPDPCVTWLPVHHALPIEAPHQFAGLVAGFIMEAEGRSAREHRPPSDAEAP
jgi:pimeloyl-ACP methyl ester carboxylesterase